MVAAPLLLKITLTYLSVASRSPFCTQDVIAPVNPLAQWLELIYIHFHKNESLNLLCILSLFLLLHYIINYWIKYYVWIIILSFFCVIHNIFTDRDYQIWDQLMEEENSISDFSM